MRAISAAQHCSVVSLLNEGYSHRQIQARTGIGKGTVGRIAKEVENNKENNTAGRPSKLSTRDKTAIIWEICSRRVDNAVQATHFINSTISQSVTPQTVRNVLKQSGFWFLLCNKEESPHVEEDTPREKARICKVSSKLDCGGFQKGLVVR